MKKSSVAVLLSAFVFPGAGHLYLKRYGIGVALATASLAATAYLFSKVMAMALKISEGIQSGAVPLDVEVVTRMLSEQPGGTDGRPMNFAVAAFAMCWLVGVVDAYRLGRLRDKTDLRLPDRKA
jgi:hypothetical protein